ncbi:FAD-dependent pyridine nucleotide-disulphide oxidoreductase [Catenulispora acidiphila DSM 44928]|uniref:FAD-dependent pyridine nucleotide-disulphide oxidoreductase n=1 Tax=Catenulispora acidiphila (strain DSM 44928 / JCM 14897 / NBRC 102108 / NRRL B-24433 / ID139908) TaxID=479433 RepID=C7Q6I5_CATAD|nr:NAD(P)/FAD-dependent oxidoreductase [Catenulispora acidiphila]ACU74020.1 FAD-dependent pyridine nucleotide-disulphide oxidoreductase [Catenulispora acidiphila DSM 44928]
MQIAVIGAGIAGLAATKVLTAVGHEVTTFDTEPEFGGVWSPTRHYPGLTTQNTRMTYEYSDHPAPASWPDYPSAEQWHSYLRSYVDRFGIAANLRLGTGVTLAEPTAAGWKVSLDSGESVEAAHLVIANGVFSRPAIPDWPGRAGHADAGGVVKAPSQHLTLDDARGKHVVVVGFGKSACDTAMALSTVAASVTMVPRRLLWKATKVLAGKHFEDVAMTRLGETLFANPRRFGPLFGAVSRATVKKHGLAAIGLIPPGRFDDIASSSASMATDGFFDAVRAGTIAVRRDRSIVELRGQDGPQAVLDDGSVLAADLIVAATGFVQSVPFLGSPLSAQNADGDFELFRNVLPHDIPNLTFAGYNTSLISSLSAEVGTTWIAAHLAGALTLPSPTARKVQVGADLEARKARMRGKYASGTVVLPRSLGNIDHMLSDMHAVLPWRVRMAQWTRRSYSTDFRETLGAAWRTLGSG